MGVEIVAVLAALGVVGYFVVARPRARKARLRAGLDALAPLLAAPVVDTGRLTSTPATGHLHLRGGYHGFHVEAWPERADPGPPGNESSIPVDQFVVRIVGAHGGRPWNCQRRRVSLNPFAEDEYVLVTTLDAEQFLTGTFGNFLGLPAPDPQLEHRLRAAGLVGAVASLGHGNRSYLPHVRFVPPIDAMRGLRPPSTSWLECRVQVEQGGVPGAERFRQLLDCMVHVVHVNARENPAA
ncbi:hypothetical protein BJF78_31335 [Pseudonocardia sp. CNS-139]|nr:hypothetical protein BJF78_31335 [Pseudonocardia sp. CNS-139]